MILSIRDIEGNKIDKNVFNKSQCFILANLRPVKGDTVVDDEGNKYSVNDVVWTYTDDWNGVVEFILDKNSNNK